MARWWREILAAAALAALLGAGGVWSLDLLIPRYAASAEVAIIPRRSTVALDERFKAIEQQVGSRLRGNFTGRRAAMVGLVHQADLAQRVFDRLRGDLDEDSSPARLLDAIDAELVTLGMATNQPNSDLIRLTASARSPALAKALADAWAETFVEDVNILFSDVPRKVVADVSAELESVRERYLEAESQLQAFNAASRVDLLDQEIAAKDAVIGEVVSTWQLTATASFQKEMTSRLASLDEDLGQLRKARTNLRDARVLRLLVDSGSASSVASNSLAIYLFKARMVTDNPNLEIRLGETPAVSAADQRQDVDITIKSLEQQIGELDATVHRQTTELAALVGEEDDENGIRSLLASMVRQLDTTRDQPMMALLAKLEREKRSLAIARQDELTTQANLTLERDLMRTTLSTLQSEVVELELTVAAAPSQVRLASPAELPVDTSWPAAPLVGVAALLAGFLTALLLAPLATAMGWQPPLRRRSAAAPD